MAEIRIGVSGWRYAPWRGVFYPADLAQRRELEYASRCFSAIELNGSFYSLQRPESYARWYTDTPPGFVFAVKGGRFITHMRKLRDTREPVANFFASGIFNLKEKLGPILWQLPPTLKYDRERLEPFLALLPHNTRAASRLARGHAAWMRNRIQLAAGPAHTVRHAIEIRHQSFLNPSFIELLRAYRIGLVVAETADRWPLLHDITADFVYIRLHGDQELYRSGYSDAALTLWARRISAWAAGEEPTDTRKIVDHAPPGAHGRDVYCFFDNTDDKLRAPFDAQALTGALDRQQCCNVGEPCATGQLMQRQREASAPVRMLLRGGRHVHLLHLVREVVQLHHDQGTGRSAQKSMGRVGQLIEFHFTLSFEQPLVP